MSRSLEKKALFKGEFNYYGELIKLFRRANDERAAFKLFTRHIAKVYKVTHYSVENYFCGKGVKWKVEKVLRVQL